MLTPPDGLSDGALREALGAGWDLVVRSIEYRPVGFGSHHWVVVATDDVRHFVTVDDLSDKPQSLAESTETAFLRLRTALTAAGDLHDAGASFVIAPIETSSGEPLVMAAGRFGVTLYPFVDGRSYCWGDDPTPAHRRAIVDLVVALHRVPATALRGPRFDDFAIPHRDELEMSLGNDGHRWEAGPYAGRTERLVSENATTIRRLLDHFDEGVRRNAREPRPTVITHGEPHVGNTMLTPTGWVLIDWDTVLVAPPERDLWFLDPGDRSIIGTYAEATGTRVQASLLDLYAVRWDLAEVAVFVSQFRAPHADSADTEKAWDLLSSLMGRLSG